MPAAARVRRAVRTDDNDRSVPHVAALAPSKRRVARGTSQHGAHHAHPLEQFGRYTIHELLGEGGMAYVHRAERAGWQKRGVPVAIALKRLFTELSHDEQFVEGFLQEARLVRLLDHPNIARSYEHGKLDGTYYMAMEYVPGPTLRATMIQSRTAAGAIPVRVAVTILMQLCAALAHAHDLRDEHGRPLNIVHRDVSPANIILSTSGTVKLIDFGIAKAAHSRVQTQVGFIKGKISYVAPEYTRGRLDHRADLFAVGVIAHEMLTNRRLFEGDDQVAIVHKIRDMQIQAPSHFERRIPRELDEIVMLCLERDPVQRWQHAAEVHRALAHVAKQLGGPVTGPELRSWVERAFACEPARESLSGLLEGLDKSVIALVATKGQVHMTPASLPAAPPAEITEALDMDALEILNPTVPVEKVVQQFIDATEPSPLFSPDELAKPRKSHTSIRRAVVDERDRKVGVARAREATTRDFLEGDGWAPPTDTQMMQARPSRAASAVPLAFYALMSLAVILGIASLLLLWMR